MFATAIAEFADRLVDELAPVTDAERARVTDSSVAGVDAPDLRLAHRLDLRCRGVADRELYESLVETVRLRNLVDTLLTTLTASAVSVGLLERLHVRSPAAMLTGLGMAPAAAHRTARNTGHATAIDAVGRGMRDGSLSPEKADAVGKGVRFVEERVALTGTEREKIVTRLMVQETPGDIATTARETAIELAEHADIADAVPAAENAALNEMSIATGDDGRVSATVDLDVLTAEELLAALDPLMTPVPEPDGSPDPRPVSKRRADALRQVIGTYLSGSERPTSGGVLPHVTLIVPTTGSTPAGASPVATLGYTGPVSPATVELVLCESAVAAVEVDQHGAPMNVGREQRLFPPAIRKALAVRDRGCAFPGCGRPVSWCDAHHVRPWSAGGDTALANGVLLCRMHHTLIHHGGWEVFIGSDGHPWFVPPAQSTSRTPIRSHARRTMTIHPTADAA